LRRKQKKGSVRVEKKAVLAFGLPPARKEGIESVFRNEPRPARFFVFLNRVERERRAAS
jgi:hypothetical protein